MQVGSDRARRTLAFLRHRISSGEWPINSKIPTEPELMQLIGVGKTTVREAVRSLASVGMLEPMPGIGTFVRSRMPVSSVLTDYLSEFGAADLLGYRRALELEAAQQAARHRTDEQLAAMRHALDNPATAPEQPFGRDHGKAPGQFHFLVMEASGNTLLVGLYAGVVTALRQALHSGTVVHATDAETRLSEHRVLLAALEAGDIAAAAHAMAQHIERDLVPAEQA
ncbi:MAG: FCD domain-containing protein [Micropruina sp.]|uniref:FadR/GntR family transcriptional regulator n=1 Tax=Micropruina sp. TaxID=2737536 RepID=UPI0039E5ED5D